jgi:hypothetical protein
MEGIMKWLLVTVAVCLPFCAHAQSMHNTVPEALRPLQKFEEKPQALLVSYIGPPKCKPEEVCGSYVIAGLTWDQCYLKWMTLERKVLRQRQFMAVDCASGDPAILLNQHEDLHRSLIKLGK